MFTGRRDGHGDFNHAPRTAADRVELFSHHFVAVLDLNVGQIIRAIVAQQAVDHEFFASLGGHSTHNALDGLAAAVGGFLFCVHGRENQAGVLECSDENGDTYYVVKEHCSWLGFDIYAAQRTAVFESSIHSVILHHVLVSLLVLFIAEVFIILSSHQLSRSILRLTRKVSQLSDPAAIAERPLLPEEMPKVTNPRDVEMRELEDVFDKQVMELKTAMRNDAELRESNLRSRLNALQAQINPHFIYNTLNIISAKSMEAGNEEVIDICGKFAQMLRYSTDLRSKTATLQEEIAHVRNYLALAKARLEDRLEYTIDIPDAFSHLTLPKLSLQPIAENAISHGYQGSSGTIHITISGTVDEDGCLHLLICDDGCGFGEEILSHLREEFSHIEAGELTEPENTSAHIGLVNTYRRLFYFSRGAIRMRVRNDGGAVVELIETRTSEEEDDVHHSDRR